MQTSLRLDIGGDDSRLDHLQITQLASNGSEQKSLHRRASGQFYTHELIGRRLAANLNKSLRVRDEYSIADPFCGDGRLACWLIEEIVKLRSPRRLRVSLWDIDSEAVKGAMQGLESLAAKVGITVELDPWIGDSFTRAADSLGAFDCVVTNPPWELLKPDRREISQMEDDQKLAYVTALRSFDARLAREYPTAQPANRFAGWGTNLSRVGTEAALRLTKPGGACGIVSPSSLFADANSDRLRAWLFANFELVSIDYFPAEARLFQNVDVPSVAFTAIAAARPMLRPHITTFDASRGIQESRQVMFDSTTLRESGFVLPIAFGPSGAEMIQELFHLPRFGNLEGEGPTCLWAGREIDETRRDRYTCAKPDAPPLVKGINIRRFGVATSPSEHVDPTKIKIPRSTAYRRLVWRDVARPSQKRRIHATLIPEGWVCGNSLGVAYFKNGDPRRLAALLGLFSSLPFEYQLRSLLSTGHVSLTTVRRVHVPELTGELVDDLSHSVAQALNGSPDAADEIEVRAAHAYGIDMNSWRAMLLAFPKLGASEVEKLLQRWDS